MARIDELFRVGVMKERERERDEKCTAHTQWSKEEEQMRMVGGV